MLQLTIFLGYFLSHLSFQFMIHFQISNCLRSRLKKYIGMLTQLIILLQVRSLLIGLSKLKTISSSRYNTIFGRILNFSSTVLIKLFAVVYLKVKFIVSSRSAILWHVEDILVHKKLRRKFCRVDSSGHPYLRMLSSFVRHVIDVNALEQCPKGT